MTQEDKELLLKDLCARLPYGVKVLNMAEGVNEVCELDSIMTSRKYKYKIFVSLTLPNDSVMNGIEMVKPYLHPVSSMTEEERETLEHLSEEYFGKALDKQIQECLLSSDRNESRILEYIASSVIIDWLNVHHFDYRGLISIGLAWEAPEGMYNIKEK